MTGTPWKPSTKHPQHWLTQKCLSDRCFMEASAGDFGILSLKGLKDPQVFYSLPSFMNLVTPYYKMLSVTPEAYGYQMAILLERS